MKCITGNRTRSGAEEVEVKHVFGSAFPNYSILLVFVFSCILESSLNTLKGSFVIRTEVQTLDIMLTVDRSLQSQGN